jgi:RNA ligase (TIGR02306 family)
MSEWRVQVVRVGEVEKHSNADTLSIVWVFGKEGYPCIVKSNEFKTGDLAVYIPVDSVVPDTPQFAFLNGHRRIKAKRLRGVFSMGLLVKCFPGYNWKEGDDVAADMGITKYEPPMEKYGKHGGGITHQSEWEKKPPAAMVRYTDIEALRRNAGVLVEGEEVVIVEKVHGCNARYAFIDGRLWVGSHNRIPRRPEAYTPPIALRLWSKIVWGAAKAANLFHVHSLDAKAGRWKERATPRPAKENTWWAMADRYGLEDLLRDYEDLIVFGEIYGAVQDLTYGVPKGENRFCVFDMFDITKNRYLNYDQMTDRATQFGLPTAPLLYRGPWKTSLKSLAEGKTTIKAGGEAVDQVREGVVIRPVKERQDPRIGRVVLKHVGQDYLLRE